MILRGIIKRDSSAYDGSFLCPLICGAERLLVDMFTLPTLRLAELPEVAFAEAQDSNFYLCLLLL